MGRIRINEKYCKGCNLCVEYCPVKVFELGEEPSEKGYFVPKVAHPERCTKIKLSKVLQRKVCGLCQDICPDFAIEIDVYSEGDE